MKLFRLAWIIPAILLASIATIIVLAQAPFPRLLIATSGDSSQSHDRFYQALASKAETSNLTAVTFLVLPIGLSSNPNTITDAERTAQLAGAEQMRQELEAGCQAYIPQGVTCRALLVPVITHKDALASPALKEFSSDPDGIFFLQSDGQAIIEALQGTDLGLEIGAAYQAGAILNGAGELFSELTILGYRPGFNAPRAMTFGAVLSRVASEQDGLAVFPERALLDERPFSQNRLGHMLNVITGPGEPQLGIGIESNNGFELVDDRLIQGVYGDSVLTILDAETYQSANAVTYQPGTNLIGLHNVLVHLLASGSTTYELNQRQTSLDPVQASLVRSFDNLHLPVGAGTILLTSNLVEDPSRMDVMIEFTNLSGGQNAHILIVALGTTDLRSAQQDAAHLGQELAVPYHTVVISPESNEPVHIDADITGIILTGPDPSQARPEVFSDIKKSWLSGVPILADRAGAELLGTQFPTRMLPDQAIPPFSPGRYSVQPGLGFLNAYIEPRGLQNFGWERQLTMAYLFPDNLALGISPGAAIRFTSDTVIVSGMNVVTLVDFRNATLTNGTSGTYEAVNGLIDIYTPGESLETLRANVEAAPIHAPTPVLTDIITPHTPTVTPTLAAEQVLTEVTETPRGKPPTRTPRPTGTPVPTPPPSDPGTTNLMVFFGVLSVVVVIVGVWLNRQIAVE